MRNRHSHNYEVGRGPGAALRSSIRPVVALLLVCVSVPSARAQTNDEGLANIQFNFLNPGARALGMGGAFVAMADDATTALANPAGLVILTRPEASIELTSTRYQNEIPWASGQATCSQQGNVLRGFQYEFHPKDFPATVGGLSFLSYVWPVRPRKLVLAVLYDAQTRYQRSFQTDGYRIIDLKRNDQVDILSPIMADLNYRQRQYGVSVALRATSRLSFGVTIAYADFTLSSSSTRYYTPPSGPPIYDDDHKRSYFELKGHDHSIAITAGVLLRASEWFSIGAMYAGRPAFHLQSSLAYRDGKYEEHSPYVQTVTLDLPDRMALGFTFRPAARLALNADIVGVLNSQLMRGYFNAWYTPSADLFLNDPKSGSNLYGVRDGAEVRFGLEYVHLIGLRPVAFRAGYWREPFHRMVRRTSDSFVEYDMANPTVRQYEPFTSQNLFEIGNHYSAGIGIAFTRFSVDAGFDFSRQSREAVISSVFYF